MENSNDAGHGHQAKKVHRIDAGDEINAPAGTNRPLRPGGPLMPPWVTAVDLERWADYRSAQSQLPALVRRLIHANSSTVQLLEMPAGEGIQRRGWDGRVVAAAGSEFIPAGQSVWEMGVGSNPSRKAGEDFRARTDNPRGVRPSESTFVFVTPRRWEGKDDWANSQREQSDWKDIRVYDSDSLEAWLESAHAVEVWFARSLGVRTPGTIDVEEHWRNLTALTDPGFKPAVFLTSRDDEVKRIDEWLRNPPSALAVEARSPAEVPDLLAAYVAAMTDAQRDQLASRIVIAQDREAWAVLSAANRGLTIVAAEALTLESEAIAAAVRNGHHVLLASNRFSVGASDKLKLSRPYVYDLAAALRDSGFSEEKARRHAMDCGGSLTVLKRRLSRFPETSTPAWSRDADAHALAPFILIGAWHDGRSSDRRIVAQVTGKEYADVTRLVHRLAAIADSPFIRVSDTWSLTSREDSWMLLASQLQPDQCRRLENAAVEVLSSEAGLESLLSGWTLIGSQEQAIEFSDSLRDGIAETLALMASRHDILCTQGWNATGSVDRVVAQVLGGRPGWKRWAVLGKQLPLLAESSPDEFLSSLEAEISGAPAEFMKLFQGNDRNPISSRCLQAGLLWALEVLAWSPQYFSRAAIALARLASLDVGGAWTNRPQNSLTEIFCLWLPHTGAKLDKRVAVLGKIAQRYPDVGWKLIVDLLPSGGDHSSGTQRPTWRDWAVDWERSVAQGEYFSQVESCGRQLVEMAHELPERWLELVPRFGDLPEAARNSAVDQLESLDSANLSSDQREKLATSLREIIGLHERHAGARWALPAPLIARLKEICTQVEPEDLCARFAWTFSRRALVIEMRATGKAEEAQASLEAKQRLALGDIYAEGGIARVLEFASSVENAWAAGVEFARSPDISISDIEVLPTHLSHHSPAIRMFAQGFAAGRLTVGGDAWLNGLGVSKWTGQQLANFALVLPTENKTWELVSDHGNNAIEAYWTGIEYYGNREDLKALEHATEMLISHGRPIAALRAIAMCFHAGWISSDSVIVKALEAAQSSEETAHIDSYDVQVLMHHLQRAESTVEAVKLSKLEWGYLYLLDGNPATAASLQAALAADPKFFAELIAVVFRPQNSDGSTSDETELSEEVQSRRQSASRLLNLWETTPGFDNKTNSVNVADLKSWVTAARQLCRTADRLEVCDRQIGAVFAHATGDSDGKWPCLAVREAIEEVDSDRLVRGFEREVYNSRGIHSRAIIQGGNPERDLVALYEGYAEMSETEWPRTAAVLRSIAKHFDADAKRQDENADARRLGR